MVSWNDAADNHDSVASDALVIPISSARPDAGSAVHDDLPVDLAERRHLDHVTGHERRASRLDDRHALEHLTDDDLDVLVVDRHTLRSVHRLDLVDEVLLHVARSHDPQDLLRVLDTGGQLRAGLDVLAFFHLELDLLGHRVLDRFGSVVRSHDDLASLLGVLDGHRSGGLADRGQPLGVRASNNSVTQGQTVRDVLTCHTTGVEGAHRQLRAGLTDRLRRDDTHRLADVHGLPVASERP